MGVGVWIGALALGVFIFYWKTVYNFIRHRRKLHVAVEKFAGPPSLPLIGTVVLFKWNISEFALQLLEWTTVFINEGQKTLRLWLGPFPVILALSPEAVKTVLESNVVITKGIEYGIIKRWLGTGLLTSTGEKWRHRRKLLTPAFHFNVLNSFLGIYDEEAQILLKQLEEHADTGKTFNFFPYIKRCALDIICATSMGTKINAQTNPNHPYVMGVQRLNELSFEYARTPWLWIEPICVQEEGKLTDEDIREEVDTFMFEGHDTTSSAMTWTIWSLAHFKEYQDKVIEEVDEIFGDSDRPCTHEDLTKMKYLEKCIKESLRLFPPVPLHTRSVEEDFDLNGELVPQGSTIMISPFILHRDTTYFKEGNTFYPDHFDQEEIATRHAFAFVPFSAGPRNCIGQKFAIMEEKTVLSWFFRKYRVDAEMPWADNIPCPEIIIKPLHGTPIKIYRRKHD
ncbi:hypothetical protein FO519_002580 [Halicephalobus sp. NKZ332]|nr:hypothetical protein FO519_002580 [Halicephalobus sp. NKZ332]